MANDFIVIHKKVLPDYFEKVLEIKELINKGESVSDACKIVGLARSTFYKYKDFVKEPHSNIERKMLLSLKLLDEPGTLLEVLKEVYNNNLNISSINLEHPIQRISLVSLTLTSKNINFNSNSFLIEIKKQPGVIEANLVASE